MPLRAWPVYVSPGWPMYVRVYCLLPELSGKHKCFKMALVSISTILSSVGSMYHARKAATERGAVDYVRSARGTTTSRRLDVPRTGRLGTSTSPQRHDGLTFVWVRLQNLV